MKDVKAPTRRTLAIAMQKGGSSKTTTAVNLAAALGERGGSVLVVDLDAQANASAWLGVEHADPSMADVLEGRADIRDAVQVTNAPGVAVLPSSGDLATVSLAGEAVVKRVLGELPDAWRYVLIDCPPALSRGTVNALVAADEVLVPVGANVLALDGLAQLLATIDEVRDEYNPWLELAGILACQVDLRTRHAREVIAELRARFGRKVFRTVIRQTVRLTEAPSFGPITQYDPRGTGAEDYRALATEIIKQERRRQPS